MIEFAGIGRANPAAMIDACTPAFTPRLTIYTIGPTLSFMALNIKNPEVERLAAEIASVTRESKTEVIRKALLERKSRLASQMVVEDRRTKLLRFLERDVWPKVPRRVLGRKLSKKEKETILGYGSRGV